jgi:hypothetical protein
MVDLLIRSAGQSAFAIQRCDPPLQSNVAIRRSPRRFSFSVSSVAPTHLNSGRSEKLRHPDWLISAILRETNQKLSHKWYWVGHGFTACGKSRFCS